MKDILIALLVGAGIIIGATLCGRGVSALVEHNADREVTWYSSGEITKNGEFYNPIAYTCAVRDPEKLDSWLRFERKGRVVYCWANDLMPPDSKAEYDLSPAAFQRLAPLTLGRLTDVKVRQMND